MSQNFVEIPLTKDQVTVIDAEDFERVSQFKWYASARSKNSGKFDAARGAQVEGKPKLILLHRFIMDAPKGLVVDHINHNSLDNRKSNLRLATHRQNCQNKPVHFNKKTKGVSFNKKYKKPYRAGIQLNRKQIVIGQFATEEEAMRAYDKSAIDLFGEFAHTNFPLEDYQFEF